MQQKYDLLILDYGGVHSFEYELSNFDKIMREAFHKIPNDEDRTAISEVSHEFASGHLTTGQYVSKVAEILKSKVPDINTFEDITISVTNPPSEAMQQLIASVKKAGLKTSLLSNMYAFEVNRTRPWGRYDGFDYVSFSAEAGLTKLDPAFFNLTLDHFGAAPDRALFVDDVLDYVEIANSIGLHTLHADHNRFANADELAHAIHQRLFDA